MRVIKAKYKRRNGSFEPLEPIELPDDAPVNIVVPESATADVVETIAVPEPAPDAIEAFHRSAGGWRHLVPEEFITEVYRRRGILRHPIDL